MSKCLSVFRRPGAAASLAVALILLPALAAAPAAAQPCDRTGCGFVSCATPATPAPSNLWGELQPADGSFPLCVASGSTVTPPFCRDSTNFNEFADGYSSFPWFMSVDSENGYAFMALAYGLEIWDARTTPAAPTPITLYTNFPQPSLNSEIKLPIQSVDAPAGDDTIAVLAGKGGMGLIAVDTTNKAQPKVLYQSIVKDGEQVYAATLGGREYGFLAASSGNPGGGVFVYDLTAARSLNRCVESYPAPGSTVLCPSVFVTTIGTRTSAQSVAGVGNFIALSSGTGRGFEIWNVADPRHASLALAGLGTQSVYGVALWQAGGHYYLALRTDFFDTQQARTVNDAQIYDVTCITGTCSGLPAPLSSLELDSGTSNFYVTYSTSHGTPYVYFGSDDKCRGGIQREWLFDVTNPAAPRDVTPNTGYWGWYYRGNSTGFNSVMPRGGKFIHDSDYFYRMGLSIFDIHKHNVGGAPQPYIFVSGPSVGQTNQAITFTATGAVCVPNPGGWNWSTSGGFISGSPTSSSVNITWTTPGDKTITATNTSCAGATGGTRSISLGDSSFLSANFSFSPGSPAANQIVTFDGSSTAGNPTLYSWDFGDTTNGTGQVTNHAYTADGAYIVHLTVTRPGTGPGCNAGVCSSESTKAVIVGNGGAPFPQADFTPNIPCINQFGFEQCSGSTGAAVTLTATATSTDSYNWNFGDSTTGTGQVVSHTWAQNGSYQVQLTVANARGTATKTKTFVFSAGGGGCIQSANRLCLGGNRFAVDVTWHTPAGQTGPGEAVALTSDTGYFWFFNDANVEMILKVLNGCTLNNHFWVFAGGLTNVRVDITVTDTATGTSKTYHNPQNTAFQPIQDTSAFATCNAATSASAASAASIWEGLAADEGNNLEPRVGTPSGTALLLSGSRFKVETTWRTPQGQTGSGQAVQLTADTGYFWFFNSANVEMVVKVLNACTLNSHFWTFAGGLTNVQVDTKVTDLQKGTVKIYHNGQNTPFQPLQDTSAFNSCP
ncbi:MAG TPA: PKD domain-containing protein [Thermoanaerobaculia bacterium]|nr:PKD domain-containing protein [Thermoanaerobaculia bacterium]